MGNNICSKEEAIKEGVLLPPPSRTGDSAMDDLGRAASTSTMSGNPRAVESTAASSLSAAAAPSANTATTADGSAAFPLGNNHSRVIDSSLPTDAVDPPGNATSSTSENPGVIDPTSGGSNPAVPGISSIASAAATPTEINATNSEAASTTTGEDYRIVDSGSPAAPPSASNNATGSTASEALASESDESTTTNHEPTRPTHTWDQKAEYAQAANAKTDRLNRSGKLRVEDNSLVASANSNSKKDFEEIQSSHWKDMEEIQHGMDIVIRGTEQLKLHTKRIKLALRLEQPGQDCDNFGKIDDSVFHELVAFTTSFTRGERRDLIKELVKSIGNKTYSPDQQHTVDAMMQALEIIPKQTPKEQDYGLQLVRQAKQLLDQEMGQDQSTTFDEAAAEEEQEDGDESSFVNWRTSTG